jgi:large subunit ribosomal protein L21
VYAIIEDGAHQYRVEEGALLDVQLHDIEDGQETVEFDKVLLLGSGEEARIGQPYIDGAKVTATIQGEVKGDKITIIKFRRRKNYRRKQGHRQQYLRVRIDKIVA